jgi:hypothetical protein
MADMMRASLNGCIIRPTLQPCHGSELGSPSLQAAEIPLDRVGRLWGGTFPPGHRE